MCFLSRSIFAQWKVETIDDGFDKYKQAWVMTSDKDARLDLIPYKGKVVLAIETPLINYSNTKNNVEISFKIKGEKRTYNVTGYASSSGTWALVSGIEIQNGDAQIYNYTIYTYNVGEYDDNSAPDVVPTT